MFASLIIVVPSLALAQAEYYHPGCALFQVQVPQGLFQFHLVGRHYSGPSEQVQQLRLIMFYPALHLLSSVLDYLACSKI